MFKLWCEWGIKLQIHAMYAVQEKLKKVKVRKMIIDR